MEKVNSKQQELWRIGNLLSGFVIGIYQDSSIAFRLLGCAYYLLAVSTNIYLMFSKLLTNTPTVK